MWHVMWLFLFQAPPASISLAVRPAICFEPCAIIASMTITGYEKTREVCLSLRDIHLDEANDPSRRSCWPWQGYTVTDVSLKNISQGEYEVTVSLPNAGVSATRPLRVAGVGDTHAPDGFLTSARIATK